MLILASIHWPLRVVEGTYEYESWCVMLVMFVYTEVSVIRITNHCNHSKIGYLL